MKKMVFAMSIAAVAIIGFRQPAAQAASTATAVAASDPAARQIDGFHAALLDSMRHAKELGLQGRYSKLAPAVDAAFDFQAMTQAIVGPEWASMSAADRKSDIDAFRRNTSANSAKNFDCYNGEQFVIGGVQERGGEKIISTQLSSPGKAPVPFVYRTDSAHGGWKIDDVLLNGYVSEVATKRADFASTLKSGGATALVQKLNTLSDNLLRG